jgi:hypothetical protein
LDDWVAAAALNMCMGDNAARSSHSILAEAGLFDVSPWTSEVAARLRQSTPPWTSAVPGPAGQAPPARPRWGRHATAGERTGGKVAEVTTTTFTVGARINLWRGGGRLTISPGSIVLEPGPLLRRVTAVGAIVHVMPTVTLVRTRLAPPWINTSLVLLDGGESGVASLPVTSRPRLRRALRAAGFTPVEVTIWLSLGKGQPT